MFVLYGGGACTHQVFILLVQLLDGCGGMVRAVMSNKVFVKDLGDLVQQMEGLVTASFNSLKDTKSAACAVQASGQEEIEEILGRLQSLESEDLFVQRVRDKQQLEFGTCEEQISQTYANLEDLHEHTAQLFQLKAKREQLIANSMADITGKMSHRKQKVKALQEATGWYKRLLSMRCEYSDAVKFIFTNVDPRDPDRVFSFSIRLDKPTSAWAMVDCNPRLETSGTLVDALNQSNEFSRFVRSMRREFELLAMRSNYQFN